MIATRQRSIHWPVRLLDVLNYCIALQRQVWKTLLFLMSPEDSTREPNDHISPYLGNSFRGSMKALFWMAAAITLAVLLGQLH